MAIKKSNLIDSDFGTDIGKQINEKAAKIDETKVQVRELSHEMNKDYMSMLIDTALDGKKKFYGDFFVVVLTKRERLIQRSLRNYFIARKSCPTPNYEQAVYAFSSKDEALTFVWMVPSKDLCNAMYAQRHFMELHKDTLLPYVVDYVEGRLFDKAIRLNMEHAGMDPASIYPQIKA